jgi:outer membrane biogenesis lipoprotein LolB
MFFRKGALAGVLVLLLCLPLSGCIAGKTRTVWVPAQGADASPLLAGDWLGQAGEHVWQLQARVTLGSRKIMLDGMLRRTPPQGAARLVLLAPMGLTLLDLEIAESGMQVHEAAKDLRKAPQVPRHVARTLERVFLPPPARDDVRVFADEGAPANSPDSMLMLEQTALCGTRVRRIYQPGGESGGSPRLVRLEAPKAGWHATYEDYDGAEATMPRRIHFRDSAGGYAVEVLLFPAHEDIR